MQMTKNRLKAALALSLAGGIGAGAWQSIRRPTRMAQIRRLQQQTRRPVRRA